LGYGTEQAELKIIKDLIPPNISSQFLTNPCFPSGYNQTFELDGFNYTVVGSSNYTDCRQLSIQLLNTSASCATNSCSIDGVYQPNLPPSKTFYAFSGFAYLYSFFNLTSTASIERLQQKAQLYCTMHWEEIIHSFKNNGFLQTYCFMGTYASVVSTFCVDFDSHLQAAP
jgi:Golgi nucleoside diphosphatase